MKNPDFIIYSDSNSELYFSEIRRKFYFPEYHVPSIYPDLSRYRDIRLIKIKDDNTLIHETMYKYNIPEASDDRYYTVSSIEEGRIDIVSLINYNNAHYWWIIAIANDIIDPINDIVEGKVLRIPSIMSLYQANSMFGGGS